MILIDLSHPVEMGIPRLPGLPYPVVRPYWTHEQAFTSGLFRGISCEVSEVNLVGNIGTHLSSPFYFDPNGKDIAELPLRACIAQGIVVDARTERDRIPIGPERFSGLDLKGKAVLVCTGWDKYWKKPEYEDHPFLTEEAAKFLQDACIRILGIDALSVDDLGDPSRPVHRILSRAGVSIVENLTKLDRLIGREFTFFAVPPKLKGASAFPVRAFALLKEGEQQSR